REPRWPPVAAAYGWAWPRSSVVPALDRVPQLILSRQVERVQVHAAAVGERLNAGIALDPTSIGRTQRLLGIELHPARQVDDREEEVAQLVQPSVAALIAGGLASGAELLELLVDLLPHPLDRLPVPSHRAGALLDLAAGGQSGERPCDAGERRRLMACIGPFGGLDRLPVAEHLLGAVRFHIAKHVGMAAHDLGAQGAVDVDQVEAAFFGRQLRMQDDLQEQVSELLRQVCGTSALDGIYRLVCLLEHEGPQSGVRLLAV